MPDAENILVFIAQVLEPIIIQAGSFVGGFFLLLFVLYLVTEMLDNARSKYRR